MSNPPSEAALSARLLATANTAERPLPHVEELIGLFGKLRKPLLRYAITFGIDAGDGEEIVQETFLALFHHLNNGKPRENLPAWLFRVCHNLTLKHIEKARAVSNVANEDLGWLADASPNPEEQLRRAQRRDKLQSVLSALTEQDRCCICLRAEGLRYRQIAEILAMSLGAVSLSLTRSLARFERADLG